MKKVHHFVTGFVLTWRCRKCFPKNISSLHKVRIIDRFLSFSPSLYERGSNPRGMLNKTAWERYCFLLEENRTKIVREPAPQTRDVDLPRINLGTLMQR